MFAYDYGTTARGMRGSAVFSADMRYRYVLRRRWTRQLADRTFPGARTGAQAGTVVWIMLNPSTATGLADDPTVTRITRFSIAAGFEALTVINLFAFRSTSPAQLSYLPYDYLIGDANDMFTTDVLAETPRLVVPAWGGNAARPWLRNRPAEVARMLGATGAPVAALGVTDSGDPAHPGRLANDTKLIPFDTAPIMARAASPRR